ncbi:MAG: hypothetical protein QXE16_03255 [Candidatus Bathyarchaeia archaeon]
MFNIRKILAAIITTGLVCFASALFVTSFTSMGLFTFGEPIFFTACLLLEPFESAFVGGVGFSSASLLLGYPHYALASLMIKSLAGFTISKTKILKNRIVNLASSLILALLFGLVGVLKFSGEIYLGYTKTFFLGERILEFEGLWAQSIYIPSWCWIAASAIIIIIIMLMEFKEVGRGEWAGAPLLSGCLLIVLGYLLYEALIMPAIFNVKVDAIANISVNGGQSILAATIAMVAGKIIQPLRQG